VQELSKENEVLKAENHQTNIEVQQLKTQNANLELRLKAIEAVISK
jgi:cell division protein FtsB